MIRSYPLTLAGVTLGLELSVSQSYFGLIFDESYAIVAWFSWISNLIFAERQFIQSRLWKARESTA
ncbi:MAG: hypothetical protein VB957_01695 [Pseudomonadales bacterium]